MKKGAIRPGAKVLVIRFSSIGDIVLTTPVVRSLKKQLGVEVHFLTKEKYAALLRPNPYVDRVLTIEGSISEVMADLRAARYAGVIDLHRNLRTLRVRWGLRRPWRSFRKINIQKWLMVRFKLDLLPDEHIVDRYLETVHAWGVHNDEEGLDHFIPEPDRRVALQRLEEWGLAKGPFVAFAIGAAHATKRLPQEKIEAICRLLSMQVVLIGGPEDSPAATSIAAATGAVSACGQASLQQSAALIERAAVVITHDTGMMHIAAALRKPIVSVWGNTIPAFGMYPYFPKGEAPFVMMEVGDLPCRPCSKIGYRACPKGHFACMQRQEATAIVSQAETLAKRVNPAGNE